MAGRIDIETGRQTDNQTDRPKDRQTDRHYMGGQHDTP